MNRPQRGELKRRGALAIFLLSAAIIITASVMAFMHFAADLRADSEQDLLAVARLKEAQIEAHLHERIGDGQVLAKRMPVWHELEAGKRAIAPIPELDAVIAQTREAYGYRSIELFDTRGRAIYPPSAVRIDDKVIAAFAVAARNRRSAFVDMHRHAARGLAYGIVQPVFRNGDEHAPVTGGVYLEIDPAQRLFPLIAEWPRDSKSAESVLLHRDGDDIVFLGPLRKLPEARPLEERRPAADTRKLGVRALQAPAGVIRGAIDYAEAPVLGASAPIAGTNWMLLSKIDQSEVEEPVRSLAWIIGSLAGIFILLAAAVSYLFWRTKQQESAAVQEELSRQYSTAIETSIDGYMRLDPRGNIVGANSALARLTDHSLGELLRMTIFDVDGDRTAEQIKAALKEAKNRDSMRLQTRWRQRGGNLIDVDISVIHVYDNDNGGGYIHCFVRDISDSISLTNRLERLSRHFAFLAHVTARIFQLRDGDEILSAFCESSVSEGHFALAWAGVVDKDTGMVRVVAAAGDAAEYARSIVVTTASPLPTSQGPTGLAIREGKTITANDFQNDPRTAPWHERARQYGIRASAVVPIVVDGKTVGALNFYSAEAGYFNDEMVELLEETSRTISLAMEAGMSIRERNDEHQRALRNESRYRHIFTASPVPKQLHRLTDGALVDINLAHQRTFGFALEEIAGDAWLEKAYPDLAFRAQVAALWKRDMEQVRLTGIAAESPELMIRCKDGTDRVVRGIMTVTDDEVILAWHDLTDIRRSEAELRESEQRFRGMVEETISGFYVIREDRFLYVNPRFCEIVGWTREELVGHSPFEFMDTFAARTAAEGRNQLEAGKKTVAYSLHLKRKDGTPLVLAVRGTLASWDNRRAVVAMAEDITERANAEDRIKDYVRRLEVSMKGTLQAVAHMVDLRDPYTAGHERRVGLISFAIGHEMGWTEQRCHDLEIVGLVHDIGKIAVPAEILSKPTKLNANEFAMIKGHAEAGYDILRNVEFDLPVADIIRQHHERMNGSGYPQGLKGDAILPEARILAVADVLESMSTHRPYRPALGVNAALEELQKNRGELYDGQVVDAVVRLVRDKGYTLPA